jgi:1-acyl-sn-glycerol-3-phosphate acyltransferase
MKRTPLYAFARTFLGFFFCLLAPVRSRHSEFMPEQGGVILCCNHMSNTDPIRLAYTQKRQIFYMAKEELFRNRFVGSAIRALGAFAVARGKGDKAAMNLAQRHLKEGDVVGIFIEGTRSKDGNFLPPKSGAVMLAKSCGVPILPCCITPVGSALPRLFRPCVINYGKPIYPNELSIEKGSPSEFREASKFVMSRIMELREETYREFRKDNP